MKPEMKLLEFKECDSCSAKTGSPVLCSGCLQNRDTIMKLKDTIVELLTEKTNAKSRPSKQTSKFKFSVELDPENSPGFFTPVEEVTGDLRAVKRIQGVRS